MPQKEVVMLAIESSCDDTSAAVLKNGKLLANVVVNQLIHQKYGGVVPELASRAHQVNIIPAVAEAIERAGIKKEEINAVAYTRGPGLLGSLLVGTSFAKAFALSLGVPLIDINHLQAHVLSVFVDDEGETSKVLPSFPFLCLTVSGGHTQIVKVDDHLKMNVIGETIDDAAGEAFDKAAKILGLPYPGGPLIDKHAQEGNADRFTFSKPSIGGYDFSFSGLKTSFLYFIQKSVAAEPDFIEKNLKDICASYQKTVVDILIHKISFAAKQESISTIVLAGGVAANSGLRKAIETIAYKQQWKVFIPPMKYCTDNAAMIAVAGYYKLLKGEIGNQQVAATARYSF